MAQLQQIFEIAAGADADAVLATPDLAYVVVFKPIHRVFEFEPAFLDLLRLHL